MKYEGLRHNAGYQKSFPGDFIATHFLILFYMLRFGSGTLCLHAGQTCVVKVMEA